MIAFILLYFTLFFDWGIIINKILDNAEAFQDYLEYNNDAFKVEVGEEANNWEDYVEY